MNDMSPSASPEPGSTPTLITLSATYGAGAMVIAPTLAERLGMPLLGPGQGAGTAPGHDRLSPHEAKLTPVHRLLASLTHAVPAGPTLSPPSIHRQNEDLRRYVAADIFAFLAAGGGVILGRAAAIVLGKDRGYHVRLDGPPDRRLAQGAGLEGISREEAQVHMKAADKVRNSFVRRLYRVDPADPSLYHLVIDSTAIPLDRVVELIVAAVDAAPSFRSDVPQGPTPGGVRAASM
jgi:cytidylate kinase